MAVGMASVRGVPMVHRRSGTAAVPSGLPRRGRRGPFHAHTQNKLKR